ncbi:MAG: RagB/SusD family nutrient uptake outer membrane protein [Bacteroidota bacterium]
MKKYIITLSILTILIFSLNSCENLLDVQQKGVVGVDDFYKTDADCEEAMANLYTTWRGIEINWSVTLNMLSDDCWPGGGSRGDQIAWEQVGEYNFDSNNTLIKSLFQTLYQIVYRANLVIENYPEPTTDIQNRNVAEAKFFRAWSYFYLTTLWGTPPVVDHVLKSNDEYAQPNGDPAELWALIEKDLTEAINSNALTEKATINDRVARITKTAAQSMLGKAYVFEEKWSDARTVLDEVISSGKYDLYQGDYEDLIHLAGEFSSENILEANVVNDPANVIMTKQVYIGWRYSLMTIAAGQNKAHDLAIGWGFINPSKSIYDAFVNEEGVNGYRLNQTLWTYQQVKDKWNIVVDGTNCTVKVNPGTFLPGHEGYFWWKFRAVNSEKQLVSNRIGFHNNPRFMRYAEVLLLAAEAHLQPGGDPGKAADYINEVRNRAQLPTKATVTMDDLKTEKRLELACEEVRYLDLVRWGDVATELANKGPEVPSFGGATPTVAEHTEITFYNAGAGFVAGKHEHLPFPYDEINVNKKIIQNPGW